MTIQAAIKSGKPFRRKAWGKKWPPIDILEIRKELGWTEEGFDLLAGVAPESVMEFRVDVVRGLYRKYIDVLGLLYSCYSWLLEEECDCPNPHCKERRILLRKLLASLPDNKEVKP